MAKDVRATPETDTPERRFLAPALTGRQRMKYWVYVTVWISLIAYFWSWWLQSGHNIDTLKYTVATIILVWISFLQVYFVVVFLRASRPVSSVEQLANARVAMVVTKTPSEPFHLVQETLQAMLEQDFPHDTWIADEDPSEAVVDWCAQNGVKISSRKGISEYHRSEWPRRTRCKEGNLAYFYDTYGYQQYDFVIQMDADHIPEQGYLREMVRPFADPAVGYVSAPSICARNASKSWSARARLNSEALFHGALQSGYSNKMAPMCIGSHYAVRTSALKDIGGLGPELAEDHSTSLIMNSNGWRGVHAIDAIAVGDGPATFTDMITQEFQWSRSLVSLLLNYTPRYYTGLKPVLKFQFVFSQVWYPLFAIFMLATFFVPIWAVVSNARFADVTFPDFILHSAPATTALILMAYQIRKDGLSRPMGASVISWERALFPLAQWPWVLWGCLIAIYDRIRGRFVDFLVTPKGVATAENLPVRVLVPIIVLVVGSLLPVLLVADATEAAGFYILSILNAGMYTALFIVVLVKHRSENNISWGAGAIVQSGQVLVATSLVALICLSAWSRGMQSLYALSTGLGPLQFVQAKSVVAGAGSGSAGSVKYVFGFENE